MDEKELRDYRAESWEWIKETLPNDMEEPFIEINTVRDAYLNFQRSLGDREMVVDDLDVPTSMSRVINSNGVLSFAFGGTLIPVSCLNHDDKQTRGGVVHEDVHDALQSQAAIYGLTNVLGNYPEINSMFNNFIEFMAHIYTARTLENHGFGPCEYYSVPVTYTRMVSDTGMPFGEMLNDITEQHEYFWDIIKNHDPVGKSLDCFKEFLGLYANQGLGEACLNAYNQIAGLKKSVIRRNHMGEWKEINPV